MAKNAWGKTRPANDPYLTVSYKDWTWKVLKAYKSRDAELRDEFSRWFCVVISPYTTERGDMGDVYVSDVPLNDHALAVLYQRRLSEEGSNA